MANEENHERLTFAALSVQPEEIQKFYLPEKKMLGSRYCMYGDIFPHSKGKERKALEKFMLTPNGRPAKMGPSEIRIQGRHGWHSENWDMARKKYYHWAKSISEAVALNDVSVAAQFLGVASHDLGDTAALPHPLGQKELDMNIVSLLFPPKGKYRFMTMHNFLENYPCAVDISGYAPVLAGSGLKETAFYFAERVSALVEDIFSRIIPALKAAYSGNDASLRTQIGAAFGEGAKVLADLIYTSYCLGRKRICEADKKTLASKKLKLDEVIPIDFSGWTPYPYFFKRIHKSPANLDMNQEPFPLMLDLSGKKKKFKYGFGVGMKARWEYVLPRGVYKKLVAYVGLNCDLPQEVPVILEISGGGKTLLREILKDIGDAHKMELDISKVSRLLFRVGPQKKSVDILGRIPCHVVIADPLLIRNN